MKGVQLACKDRNCDSADFVLFINWKMESIISLCSQCGSKMFVIPLSHEEILQFKKDFIEQELDEENETTIN